MTVGTQPTTIDRAAPAAAARTHRGRTALIAVFAVALLFVLTYAFAWTQANRLSTGYLADADQLYAQGDYLKALVGYQDFDPNTNRYVTHGGYMQVERIWINRYAWPAPAGVQRARQRIDEIVNQKLTIDQAEQFIQENTGKQNPYFGVIYLRLGELYEQNGRTQDAVGVYQDVVQTFKDQPDLVQTAQAHLAKLQGK
jgi:hypothetical protein